MRRSHLVLVFALLVLLSSCGSSGVKVTAEEYGDAWPFNVEEGTIDCDRLAALFRSNGTTYVLNGVRPNEYTPVERIWRDNPSFPGLKINIGPMIQLALQQCE